MIYLDNVVLLLHKTDKALSALVIISSRNAAAIILVPHNDTSGNLFVHIREFQALVGVV